MACKLPPHFRKAIDAIASCQRYNPSDSTGSTTPCQDVMMKAMARVGTRFLGRGNFRHAWGYKHWGEDCVVKVANNGPKRKHNIIEAETWKRAPDRYRRFLTPVADEDPKGLWLVMPRAKNETISEPERAKIGHMIEQKFMKEGLDIQDQHTGNVGILHGQPVSIDYGFGLVPFFGIGHAKPLAPLSGLQERQMKEFNREVVAGQTKMMEQWVIKDEKGQRMTDEQLKALGFGFKKGEWSVKKDGEKIV